MTPPLTLATLHDLLAALPKVDQYELVLHKDTVPLLKERLNAIARPVSELNPVARPCSISTLLGVPVRTWDILPVGIADRSAGLELARSRIWFAGVLQGPEGLLPTIPDA